MNNLKCKMNNEFKNKNLLIKNLIFSFFIIHFSLFIFLLTACTKQADKSMESTYQNIRQPVVAGQFYSADANQLKVEIERYLVAVEDEKTVTNLKAIMVPHAGYVFSAPVAAYSFKQIQGQNINTAVIICNSHSAYFNGIAIDDSDAWRTPLGLIPVDKEMAGKLVEADEIMQFNSKVHVSDHTLEVQLPFLQTVVKDNFKIVPILFGNTHDDSYKKLAKALADNLGSKDIVVISTDMSHYPSYEDANKVDQETLEMIKTADISKLEEHINQIESQNIPNEQTMLCGIDGVKTIMEVYNLLGWDRIEILKYANSGDAPAGDKGSVVGYGAVAFGQTIPGPSLMKEGNDVSRSDNLLNSGQKEELLNIAKTTVESFVREGKKPDFEISEERLNWKEGAFVTLHKDAQLRGCIGQIIPTEKPLWQVVRDMAVAACSEDYRFSPVSEGELEKIDYEVSVLSVPEKVDNWQDVQLGKHGVILRKGIRTGVFLPQVADETGWSKEEFLSQLCWQKAGLSPDCYKDDDIELEVFTAQVFSE
jgi:AmmeMemoRadiSam system protein B/AmmeMemoRadiSam system protein A